MIASSTRRSAAFTPTRCLIVLATASALLVAALAPAARAGVITLAAHTDNARLIDSDGDDLGNTATVSNISSIGVGENNGGSYGTDEGRWWLPFDLSGYEDAIANATSVRLSMQADAKQNVTGYGLDIYGYENRTSVSAVAADYQAAATLLVHNALTASTPNDTMQSFNVTDFVKAQAAGSPSPLAVFRVQVDPADLPNTDSVRNNFIMRTADAVEGQRPTLTITPPPEFLEVREFDSFTFTTAANNGESPATSGVFHGPFYVRERTDASTQLQVRAFLEFDLADLGTTKIDTATLVLHENNKLNSVNSADLWLGQVADDWDLDGNTPIFDQAIVSGTDFTFGTNGLATEGPAVDITFEIDVTDIVRAWQASPSSNYGFRLWLSPNMVGAAFDYQGELAPLLVVQYGVPEPAGLVLLGLGVVGLAPLFRRRTRRKR